MTLLSDAGNISKRGFVLAVALGVLMPGWIVYSWVFKTNSRPPQAEAAINLNSGRTQEITPPADIEANEQKTEKKQAESLKAEPHKRERTEPVRQKQKSALQQMQEKMRLAAYYLPPGVKGVGVDGRRQAASTSSQNGGQEHGNQQVKELPSVYQIHGNQHQSGNSSVWTNDFYERGNGQAGQYQRASSPFVVRRGWTIEAVLDNDMNTDTPGQITATLTRNLYDSATGKILLAPSGSAIVGAYDTRTGYGQQRIPMGWDWLYLPNGDRMSLSAMPGADRSGMAGIPGKYNGHLWQRFWPSFLLTVSGATADVMRSNGYGGGSDLNYGEALSRESGQQIDRRSREVWGRGGYSRPTLTAESGEVFLVQVTSELRFPGPYRDETNIDFAEVE